MASKGDIAVCTGSSKKDIVAEESSLTMLDVLEQEQELEEEYAAVLGASDEKCCTYAQGAIKRQALYSCLTCCPEARENLEKCAGICLACSYRCHENHELVELYTKRNFRCDCPTVRHRNNRCLLNPDLDGPQPPNVGNVYDQNFQGLYCTCHRPYPDPERTTEEVMLQCTICEDWYHLQHQHVPPSAAKLVDTCTEMICEGCMKQHTFLRDYTGLALKALDDVNDLQVKITISSDCLIAEDNDNKLRSDLDKSISEIMGANDYLSQKEQSAATEPECKRRKLENAIALAVNNDAAKALSKCRRPTVKIVGDQKGATFWGNDLRSVLCRCVACLELYEREKVEFLLDADDSAKSYEERGMRRAATESSTYEQGIRALASMERVQQIDAITEYNRMKDKLKEYLQEFAASKKIVTEEDINRFFAGMRNENNAQIGQPHFCR